ncbi:ATP-binding protein [Peptoniphilus sp. KCTC 25270]|uniref:ATP-binding protein n=1 Tax=Peptoniphilus sp. KCTC 25270 TaxID=2897414 RepID=UPI001E62D216|nr:ATP-binding protein [Peptoniphilus sp. KCTC 25270]MCD1147407.1 ATP-binding protein [Peptoniphilus sp. KCTC 25270]
MDWKKHHRVLIVTGHFGSGKTEFSINLGLHLRELGENVSLVDLDIINTYFRLREEEDFLEKKGIHTYYSAIKATSLDLPALDPAIDAILYDKDRRVILDVGGNPSGARALARYQPSLEETGYEQLFVINANRPETKTAQEVIDFMEMTQATSGTQITGLFNTTHFLKDTTAEDVINGLALAEEVSDITGLPLLGTVCLKSLEEEVRAAREDLYILPIDLYFRDSWML